VRGYNISVGNFRVACFQAPPHTYTHTLLANQLRTVHAGGKPGRAWLCACTPADCCMWLCHFHIYVDLPYIYGRSTGQQASRSVGQQVSR
jgi:hypothetical protein